MDTNKITIFNDSIGRLVVGLREESNQHFFKVKCPAVVDVMPHPQEKGKQLIQLLPFIFSEFVDDQKPEELVWSFPQAAVVFPENLKVSDIVVSEFSKLFPNQEPEQLKLFDDE